MLISRRGLLFYIGDALGFGELLASARAAGRRVGAMDAIIAATALAHDLSVWTRDGNFDVIAEPLPPFACTEADLSLHGGSVRNFAHLG